MFSKTKRGGRYLLLSILAVGVLIVVTASAAVTCPTESCKFTGSGVVRVGINSDSNAGVLLNLANTPQWSLATVTGGAFTIYDETGGINRLYVTTEGNIGIGTTTPRTPLDVRGEVQLAGSLAFGGLTDRCVPRCVPFFSGITLTLIPNPGDWPLSIGDATGNTSLFSVDDNGNIRKKGTVSFVEDFPDQPDKEIVYASLEGPEAGTYTRGTASLVNGEAVIQLPNHFEFVTGSEGLTVILTPLGEWLQLYVAEQSPKQIIVREAQGKNGQFNYLVQGVRRGYENYQVIREK